MPKYQRVVAASPFVRWQVRRRRLFEQYCVCAFLRSQWRSALPAWIVRWMSYPNACTIPHVHRHTVNSATCLAHLLCKPIVRHDVVDALDQLRDAACRRFDLHSANTCMKEREVRKMHFLNVMCCCVRAAKARNTAVVQGMRAHVCHVSYTHHVRVGINKERTQPWKHCFG